MAGVESLAAWGRYGVDGEGGGQREGKTALQQQLLLLLLWVQGRGARLADGGRQRLAGLEVVEALTEEESHV